MRSVITLFVLLALAGCATAPLAPPEKDAAAKKFETNPDMAGLYIYRNESFGGAISMDISVNGKTIGNTAPKSYFKLDLPPGTYHLESRAENTSVLDIAMQSGQNYFVWQEIKMGIISARSKLQAVAEAIGKKGVSESRLINTAISTHDLAPEDKSLAYNSQLSVKLAELKSLHEKGEITQSEYEQAKTKLLGEFK